MWGEVLYRHFRRLYLKDPKLAADALFRRVYHRHINLEAPKHLVEKITWLQLNTDTSLWTLCADKYRMREYVKSCGLSDNLPQLFGHWDNPDELDFENLPNSFVLKANNGCGTVMIVKDKTKLNDRSVKRTLKKWLRKPYGYHGAQSHYLRIKPCILAEELLPNTPEQALFSPESMVDYKIWCFNGKPECCLVIYDRNRKSGNLKLDLYDLEWNRMYDKLIESSHYKIDETTKIPKPKCLDEMIRIASILSQPFPELRLDMYNVNGKVYVGEMTFTSGYGLFKEEYYNYLGSKININGV